MTTKKRGLGRGLDALLGSMAQAQAPISDAERGDALRELPLGALTAGKHQPRRNFNEAQLAELTESIKAQGVVQPIVVRPNGLDRYEIVAGERRWRAAQAAGLATIPAVIRNLDERAAMAVALVENIQRADLNALEEAEALQKLIQECGLTHEQCAHAVGKSRVAVTHLLRLTDLTAEAQGWLRAGDISFGHAKVLLALSGPAQISAARQVVEKELSVRQTEALVASQPKTKGKPAAAAAPSVVTQGLEKVTHKWGITVKVQQGLAGKGTLKLAYKSEEQLAKLLAVLG